ncbi:MAG: hypothetical protein EOP02_06365 [Proteobacteria bacterium]|uniref:hypothetical protein n=1 Tax=Xanthomonas arboricola TaxID=56448 RepID=UPI0010F289EF|nr:hypothetical protein [Xanthomonas arboricola]RZA28801.1 MAG: hypothetical protein EOP02_06365 [Pseudomonadota bacterium]
MGMLDGVSQCWWLSKACEVNWDAWAAIATAIGTCLALAIATRDGLQRMKDRRAAAKLALISIWPFAHKAAGCTSTIAHELQRSDGVHTGALGTAIQELRESIEKISSASGRLDAAMSLRVTAAVSLGGYLARQSSRLLTRDIDAAITGAALSKDLIAHARTATQHFLDIATSAEEQTTAITGQAPPSAD